MSIHAIEKALWQASTNPEDAGRLRQDADGYLRQFRLDEQERALMTEWDIRGLVDLGVHPMVVMMANAAVYGPDAAMAYVQKVNTPGSR